MPALIFNSQKVIVVRTLGFVVQTFSDSLLLPVTQFVKTYFSLFLCCLVVTEMSLDQPLFDELFGELPIVTFSS